MDSRMAEFCFLREKREGEEKEFIYSVKESFSFEKEKYLSFSFKSINWMGWNSHYARCAASFFLVASSRDALRQFSANLKSNSEFSDVDVPVSNFAKSKENDFSITLKLVKKNDK
jgi:hypothetical protein